MSLCEAAKAVCEAIVAAPEAWARRERLEQTCGAAAVGCALASGTVEVWDLRSRPEYGFELLTLTPWGVTVAGVEMDEVWRKMKQVKEERDDTRPLAPAVCRTETVKVEVQKWAAAGKAKHKTDKLPRHAKIGRFPLVPLNRPDLLKSPGPEYLADESGRPVTVMGVPVRVDRRLR